MGRKIFVSYKYGDSNVKALPENPNNTTARFYVNELQSILEDDDHINKGELDGQSLADFSDSTIESKLRDRIYDSTLTIVLISPNMKSIDAENDQWIPWEISYSLREKTRAGRTSGANALLAIVLPDRLDSYEYFIKDNSCSHCNSRTLKTNTLFNIFQRNSFNIKNPEFVECASHETSNKSYRGRASYIQYVKWQDFKKDPSRHINEAYAAQKNIDSYNVSVSVMAASKY